AQTPGFLVSAPDELKIEHFESKISELSKSPTGKYYVATIGDRIVAHGLLDPMGPRSVAHIVHLTIVAHEGHRSKGIGKRLLSALIDWAQLNDSIQKIELRVRESNTAAIA